MRDGTNTIYQASECETFFETVASEEWNMSENYFPRIPSHRDLLRECIFQNDQQNPEDSGFCDVVGGEYIHGNLNANPPELETETVLQKTFVWENSHAFKDMKVQRFDFAW